ncbi:putative Dilute domain-containing protein [Arabidopsis thaliana]
MYYFNVLEPLWGYVSEYQLGMLSLIQVPDNNEVLAYWLSNLATLLLLLQRTLKAAGAAS